VIDGLHDGSAGVDGAYDHVAEQQHPDRLLHLQRRARTVRIAGAEDDLPRDLHAELHPKGGRKVDLGGTPNHWAAARWS